MVSFPPFRIDLDEERLWKGERPLALRRKPFAILRYLVAHPGQLVTHDELMKNVWGDVTVSESSVRTHLHELRQALGEGLIETVIGRGYRFTGVLRAAAPERPALTARVMVGRANELAQLHAVFERAQTGERQLCFITGEPGIGKTTLVASIVDELEGREDVLVARGHCFEQHGTAEPYLPVIEIFGRFRGNPRVLAELVRSAPTFLAQAPSLVPDAQIEDVLRRARGGTESRMVRELVEAIEALGMQQTLVLVLEDLQWADLATLDLLAVLGQRRERARLLVIATSRRAEANTTSHPLNRVMRPLVARNHATAITLDPIAAADVGDYLAQRFAAHDLPPALAAIIDRITGGIPLFVSALVDDLVARGMLVERDERWTLAASLDDVAAHRADSVRQLIDIQLDRLTTEEQRLLEAGSLLAAVSTGLVAAALETSVEATDDLCDELARRSLFLRRDSSDEWPDGSLHTRYAFTHGLVQAVCAGRAAPARRQRWHLRIAERLEAAYGERADEVSVTLASHFQHAQVAPRAVHYFVVAAERAQRRFASADAIRLYRVALDLLPRLPEAQREEYELRILGGMTLPVLRLHEEYVRDPESTFVRRLALARRSCSAEKICAALLDFVFFRSIMGNHVAAWKLLDEVDGVIAGGGVPPELVSQVESSHAVGAFWRGDFARALEILERVVTSEVEVMLAVGDRRVLHLNYLAMTTCIVGQPDRGLREIERATALAAKVGDPYTHGLAATMDGSIRMMRGDPPEAIRASAQRVLDVPAWAPWHPPARMFLAWVKSREAPLDAAAADELIAQYRERIAMFPLGATTIATRVAASLVGSPREAVGLEILDTILADSLARGEGAFRAELLAQRADMLAGAEAVAAYRDALEVARASGARLFELRAALGLHRLQPAHAEIEAALAGFVDGDQTADVIAARAILG